MISNNWSDAYLKYTDKNFPEKLSNIQSDETDTESEDLSESEQSKSERVDLISRNMFEEFFGVSEKNNQQKNQTENVIDLEIEQGNTSNLFKVIYDEKGEGWVDHIRAAGILKILPNVGNFHRLMEGIRKTKIKEDQKRLALTWYNLEDLQKKQEERTMPEGFIGSSEASKKTGYSSRRLRQMIKEGKITTSTGIEIPVFTKDLQNGQGVHWFPENIGDFLQKPPNWSRKEINSDASSEKI